MIKNMLIICKKYWGKIMKKWHVEGILYLNDSNKSRLALPEAQQLAWYTPYSDEPKKESLLLQFLRWIVGPILRNF